MEDFFAVWIWLLVRPLRRMSRGMGMSFTEWLREQMVSAEVMTRRGCFPFFLAR
jgi:hypothetical protein